MTTLWWTAEQPRTAPIDPGRRPPPGVGAEAIAGLTGVQAQVAQARSVLGAGAEPELAAIDQARRALSAASDHLMTALVGCGVETPRGRQLHNLRDRLDAHLLAADALRDAEAPEAVLRVLRRTIDFIGLDLGSLAARQLPRAES